MSFLTTERTTFLSNIYCMLLILFEVLSFFFLRVVRLLLIGWSIVVVGLVFTILGVLLPFVLLLGSIVKVTLIGVLRLSSI